MFVLAACDVIVFDELNWARARSERVCVCVCVCGAAATGRKTDSARTPGPAPRAPGRAPPPHRRRWVPPSSLRHHEVPDGDAKHDIIFRKVRGILNKLTPEKFQKLSDDLLGLQLDSDKVLKGVILLIFEKALDEPKYSSMYAQLCKRLSEEAPNFEPPGQPCTFKLLLLNKCRAEFENRAQAFAAYEDKTSLTPEEEEKRHLAKCKMLGNIKFIGELGKLEILAESILHRCIQALLARRAAADHHEDLECLAQLVRTCGRVLDSERGRGLMDQYFARIDTLSAARELAPRIRFMLRDVAELRRGGWVPRAAAAASAEGPVPIQQLRDTSPPGGGGGGGGGGRAARGGGDLFRRARPLDDVLAGLSLAPPLQAPSDKLFGNGFPLASHAHRAHPPRSAPSYYQRAPPYYGAKQPPNHQPHQNKERGGGGGGGAGGGKPRLGGVADVEMRPAANSLLFSASARLQREPHAPALAVPPVHSALPAQFAAPLKEPPLALALKQPHDAKQKPKKDKGTSKEEACKLAVEAVEEAWAARRGCGGEGEGGEGEGEGEGPALRRLLAAQLPDKLLRRAAAAALEHALAHPLDPPAPAADPPAPPADPAAPPTDPASDEPAPLTPEESALAAAACYVVLRVKRAPLGETWRALVAGAGAGESRRLGALLAHGVRLRLLALGELAACCEAAGARALVLAALQLLRDQLGVERLHQLCVESKINVCAFVEGSGAGAGGVWWEGAGGALAALEARGLGALAPQLRLQALLARQLAAEPAPPALWRWLKANVEPAVRGSAPFVSALVALLARHVTEAAGTAPAALAAPDKQALDREKTLVEGYAPLLTALLEGRPELQLAAVYAVQLHAHHHHYPKGMLLRWFMYLYNLEVCDEDAFLRWREDVTDAYPDKGKALFQVNTWLTWLQQQESEDEEAED